MIVSRQSKALRFGSAEDYQAFCLRNPSLPVTEEQRALLENLLSDDFGPVHTDTVKQDELTTYAAEVLRFLAGNVSEQSLKRTLFLQPFLDVRQKVANTIAAVRDQEAQLTPQDERKLQACLERSDSLITKLAERLNLTA
ncbi:MAG TPA: hypothetical protein V6C52_14780 [Coleofasciculaceae cyanobacterium]|jgi:hypothetical protein